LKDDPIDNPPSPAGAFVDIGRLIDEGSWGLRQKWVLALAALAFAMEGMAGQALGPAIPSMIKAWGAPRAAFAPVAALGLVGFIIGAAAGGAVGDRIGRRFVLLCSMALIAFATIGCGVAHDTAQLGAWRVAAGVGLGASIPAATALIAEFTPARRRSLAIAFGVTFLPLGGAVSGMLASYTLTYFDWRALFFATGAITVGCAALFLLLLPESPRLLARKPHRREALLNLLKGLGLTVGPNDRFVDPAQPAGRTPLLALVRADLRRDTLLLWGAFFALVFAMYTVFSWMPTALVATGLSMAQAGEAVSVFALGGVAGNILSGWLTGRFGSRLSVAVQVLLSIGAACGLPLASGGDATLMLGLLVALGAGVSGVQTALYVVASSLYGPSMRSSGLGAAVAVGRVGALLSSYAAVAALDVGGPPAYFLGIALLMAAALGCSLAVRAQIPGRRG
jgi:AAHS family 4-hydroxybenzoate transporter-like MFS transporter